MKQQDFSTLLERTKQQELNLHKTYNQISALRFFCFLLFAVCIIYGVMQKSLWGYLSGGAFFVVFLILIAWHSRVASRQSYQKSRHEVLTRYCARFGDEWHHFPEDGTAYLSEDFPAGKDLDVFGKKSLYQYLCCANTRRGQNLLASWLKAEHPNREEILRRQEAVQELAQSPEFSIHLQTLGRRFSTTQTQKSSEEGMESFLSYLRSKQAPLPLLLRIGAWVLPTATIAAIVLFFVGLLPAAFIFIGVMLQLICALLVQKRVSLGLSPLFSFHAGIQSYKEIFSQLEQADFHSDYLRELQSTLRQQSGACQGIHRLAGVCELVKVRHNPLLYAVGLCLLMWDSHCLLSIERWKNRYGTHLEAWLNAVGEIEALLSLSVLGQVRKVHCYPQILSGKAPQINARELTHPLIPEDSAVENPVGLCAKTCIVTGSNMSGKTTYLRTIGINALLAFAGAPTCAASFSLSCMAIFTSMRIEDDVSRGISTFYAEILRIRSMVEYSGKQQPMLVLIDEIFKGTNSADRIIGATETIKKLSVPWSVTVVSTHDFELCALSENSAIRAVNFHFSESYTGDEIHFDYRLKEGRCHTTNAQHLLRMAGILS